MFTISFSFNNVIFERSVMAVWTVFKSWPKPRPDSPAPTTGTLVRRVNIYWPLATWRCLISGTHNDNDLSRCLWSLHRIDALPGQTSRFTKYALESYFSDEMCLKAFFSRNEHQSHWFPHLAEISNLSLVVWASPQWRSWRTCSLNCSHIFYTAQ